jgi:molecular chaperone DnaK
VFQSRKQIKEFGDKIPANLKSKIESSTEALDAAVKSNSTADLKAKIEALNAAWNEASSHLYQQAAPSGQQQAPPPPPGPGPQGRPEKPEDKAVEDASYEVVDDKDK